MDQLQSDYDSCKVSPEEMHKVSLATLTLKLIMLFRLGCKVRSGSCAFANDREEDDARNGA